MSENREKDIMYIEQLQCHKLYFLLFSWGQKRQNE